MNDRLIKKTFKGLLLVNLVSMVSAIACVMIDAIVIGQFLGSGAVAAMGLITPVVMLCNIAGTLFGPGLGVVCTRYMGMAKPDRVNQVFSLIVIILLSLTLTLSMVLFISAPILGNVLGGKTADPEITEMILKYIRGFCIGIPFQSLAMCMAGLMMLDNDRKRSVAATFATLLSDVLFDLLNVLVFHGGMFGMAFATSMSSVVGFLVVMTHFLKKDRILAFTSKGLRLSDIKEVVLCGIPNSLSSGCMSVRNMVFNGLLLSIGTKASVSAISVTNSAYSVVYALTLGMLVSTSTMISLFYGEEDRNGIETAYRISQRIVVTVLAAVTALLLIFANPIAGMFLRTDDPAELGQAAVFIRCMIVQTFIMSISYPLGGAHQALRHMGFTYLIVSLREGIFPVVCAVIMGLIFGINGMGTGIVLAGVLTFFSCFIIPSVQRRKPIYKPADMLLLNDDFGSSPEDTFEVSVTDIGGVMTASHEVMEFCGKKGTDSRTAMMTSLFVEEAVGNIVTHGFAESRNGSADLRVIYGKDKLIIRIRDDGKPFDPVDWYKRNHPDDPASGAGIRVIVGLADDVRCIPAMGLNNLMIIINYE